MSTPIISLVNDQPRTLSIDVAAYFGKPHKNVLQSIRNTMINCPESFNGLNFKPVEITDAKGEKRPAYSLTKNAFMLVVMGLTGHKAMQCKLAYMARFDAMEAELSARTRDAFRLTAEDARPLEVRSKVPDRKGLNKLVSVWFSLAPITRSDAWSMIHARYEVSSIEELTLGQVKDACDWVQGKIDAVAVPPALPAPQPTAGKVPQHIIDVIMKASHRNLDYQKTLRELERQLFNHWLELDDCFMSLAGGVVKAA